MVALSQCLSDLPSFMRHMSNHVVVYFLHAVLGSSNSRESQAPSPKPS